MSKCQVKLVTGVTGLSKMTKAGKASNDIQKVYTGLVYQKVAKSLYMVRAQKNGLAKPVHVTVSWDSGATVLSRCSAKQCNSLGADIQRWGKEASLCSHVLSVHNIAKKPAPFAEYKEAMTLDLTSISDEYKEETLKPYLLAAKENGHPALVPFVFEGAYWYFSLFCVEESFYCDFKRVITYSITTTQGHIAVLADVHVEGVSTVFMFMLLCRT